MGATKLENVYRISVSFFSGVMKMMMKNSAPILIALVGLSTTNAFADCTDIVAVPWKWSLSQTIGTDKNYTGFKVDNDGPTGTVVPGSSTLGGSFTVSKQHTPPSWYCARLDPLPSSAIVDLAGVLDGIYANTTLGFDLKGVPFETYVKVDAAIDLLPVFPPLSYGTGSGSIDVTKTAVEQWGVGVYPYTGSLNVDTKFGFGLANLNYIDVFSQLYLNGTLRDPVVNIRYLVPVPSAVLLGMIGLSLAGVKLRKRA